MPITIKTANMKYKNSEGEYVGVNAISDNTTAEQLARIEDKGDEVIASIPSDYTALDTQVDNIEGMIASEFNTSTAYAVGDLVIYNDHYYRFKTAHPAGAWNASHVDQTTVSGEIISNVTDLKNSFDDTIINYYNVVADKINPQFIQGYFGADGNYVSGDTKPDALFQITSSILQLPPDTIITITSHDTNNEVNIKVFEKNNFGLTRIKVIRKTNGTISKTTSGNYCYSIGVYNAQGISPEDSSNISFSFSNPVSYNKGVYVKNTNETDCNNILESGIYKINTNFSNIPFDMNNNGALFVAASNTSRILQILFQNAGINARRNNRRIWMRVYGGDGDTKNGSFTAWAKLVDSDQISISYQTENEYLIEFGKYTLKLFHILDNNADQDNWNIGRINYNDTIVVPSGTDIIGPIKVSGDNDFLSGVHGSSTTTNIKVYCDGKEITLDSSLSVTCDKIVIMMKDECRRTLDLSHVFDRYVTIEITKNKIHISNTYKNVSGNTITVERATNGGLMAVRNNILVSSSMQNLMLFEPPVSSISNKSNKNVSVIFNLNMGTIRVNNIIGHEEESYEGFYTSFYQESIPRLKSYFDIISSNTNVDNNELISGEFEYLFT